MSSAWWTELWRALAVALVALVVGLGTGRTGLVLSLALLGYLGWHLRQLYRVHAWLSAGAKREPPDVTGIWDEFGYNIQRLRARGRKQKRKLARVLARFQQSAAAIPDAVVVLGPGGEIQWLNDMATRLLGLRMPQDIGHPVSYLVRNPVFLAYLARGDFSEPLEFSPRGEEQRILAVRIVPYGADQRLMLAQDVTQLHRLETVRRDFVANVSHELRTPLTVLHGFVENLRDAACTDHPELNPALELMHQQTLRMQRVVDDLLLLSRLEAEAPGDNLQPVDVGGLLALIRREAGSLDPARHIQVDADGALALQGVEQELRSAFSNLVVNAVQHTPPGRDILVRWSADGAGARLDVVDRGDGIPPEHLPRLTERFYRVDVGRSRRRGGTGLGLAIVKHVLERHGARLEIASEPGQGSTFSCRFPPARVVRQALRA